LFKDEEWHNLMNKINITAILFGLISLHSTTAKAEQIDDPCSGPSALPGPPH